MAFIVVVWLTVIGPEYKVDEAVGVLPSVVYLMFAAMVSQLSVTFWISVYVPAVGLKVGVAARALRLKVAFFHSLYCPTPSFALTEIVYSPGASSSPNCMVSAEVVDVWVTSFTFHS